MRLAPRASPEAELPAPLPPTLAPRTTHGAPAPQPHLVAVAGPQQGRAFELRGDDILIGRGCCDGVALSSRTASQRHALLRRAGSGYRVQDAGSRNGTRVRAQPLRPGSSLLLRHGDTLHLGEEVFVYCDAARQPARQALAPLAVDVARVRAEVDALVSDLG